MRQQAGARGEFYTEWLDPIGKRSILARVLGNLKAIYIAQRREQNADALVVAHDPLAMGGKIGIPSGAKPQTDGLESLATFVPVHLGVEQDVLVVGVDPHDVAHRRTVGE